MMPVFFYFFVFFRIPRAGLRIRCVMRLAMPACGAVPMSVNDERSAKIHA